MTKKIIYQQISDTISQSNHILMCLHPSPDEDSVGSCLAMYWYLKHIGKNPTVIAGDSELPNYLSCLPGVDKIFNKNIFDLDLFKYDLFIALDQSSLNQISKINNLLFPPSLKLINIDHHQTNDNYAHINFVDSNSPATCQILFYLFESLNIDITPNMAINLFAGIWSDTLFKYPKTTSKTFSAATKLTRIYPEFPDIIFQIENNQSPGRLIYKGLALKNIHKFFNNNLVVSVVSHQDMEANNLIPSDSEKSEISNILKSVVGWNIAVSISEIEPYVCNLSFRTRDFRKFDVSLIAQKLGGGGHPAASGAQVKKSAQNTLKDLVKAVSDTFPFLNET